MGTGQRRLEEVKEQRPTSPKFSRCIVPPRRVFLSLGLQVGMGGDYKYCVPHGEMKLARDNGKVRIDPSTSALFPPFFVASHTRATYTALTAVSLFFSPFSHQSTIDSRWA